ncbi:MAG TPA: hypothetical protein PKY82_15530 [Pyrinomonadaceae bacterium]|nr:hypothetical protein [Pyrinomonadaceae bacterium]
MTPGETDSAEIKKLTKRKKETGELYTRRKDTELQLGQVLNLPASQIIESLKIKQREDRNYLLDETIVYLLRDPKTNNNFRETLYTELNRRLWKLLKKFAKNFNNQADFEDFGQKIEIEIIKKIFEFTSDSADYAQVNFGDYVIKTAKVVWRGELVKISREKDFLYSQGEDEDENYVDSIENKLESNDALTDYTLMLKEGLNQLPPHIMTVAELLLDGWQIESKVENELTISKKLKVSSRTIRNWLTEGRRILADYNAEVRK